jgi:carbon-monoxide dehydrogenase large subunit
MSIETVDADESGSGETVGEAVRRREDPHLLAGDAEYVDDIQYPGTTHLAILRSQYAHAHIESIDTSAAEDADGVLAVYTREDLLADGLDGTIPGDDPDHGASVDRPFLAGEKTRYQGDPIAGVVAEDRYVAHDALDLIEVEYERLDAVPGVSAALDDDAPTIHEEAPDNVAFEWDEGEREATMAAFDGADRVVEIDLSINKVIAVPLETRAAVARYDAADGDLHVELGCQSVLGVQDHLSDVLGVPEHRVHVRAPDVGGAFGVKAQPYTGHIFAAWCSMQLERPVKWVATRTEAFTSTNHSRRHDLTARAALDDGGRITGLHVDSLADVGGYMTSGGAGVPTGAFGTRLLGEYDIPAAYVEVTGAFTNTTTLSAYRGAGRPEAAYVIERLASACARELGEDPVEFRRRNFIDPDDFPYETPFGSTYDSGDYEKPLDRALELVDYENLRERQAEAREEGRYLGIGISTYIEICGGGSGSLQGGQIRMTPSGKVLAMSSKVENGQGHGTGFAQVVADELGVDYDDVEIVEGDTDRVPEGGGTGGSSAMTMGGNALKESARKLKERAREVAAHELEADPEDLESEDGEFHVAGVPSRAMTIQEAAEAAYSGDLPEELRGMEDTTFFSPDGSTAPFGTHIAVVEVEPETGEITLEEYVAVDDVGNQINPKLVEGQIVGGIVQSLGQALLEGAEYDGNGNLVTGSLQDYALPRAEDVPEITWDSTVTPSPNNPLGAKGVGEAGTIGALPVVVNAVADALEPFDVPVDGIDMPLTNEAVWRAIGDASPDWE